MIVHINEGRVINSVKKCTEKSDAFSESFGPHDSASKILQIKINLNTLVSFWKILITSNDYTKIQLCKNFMKSKDLLFY